MADGDGDRQRPPKVGAHHHRPSKDNDNTGGSHAAAWVHFSAGKDRPGPPRHGPRRSRGVPDASTATGTSASASASQPVKHRRFRDPIPPDQPLLGIPLDDAAGHDPDQLFEAYKHNCEHNERSREYLWTGRPMHPLMDVFFWWFLRVWSPLSCPAVLF